MATFRVEKSKGYTVMSNHHLRDKSLSLKAKGLLSQMLSLPEDWDYTLAGLSLINREKVDAIRIAVRELEGAGYIVRSRERDEKGRLRGTVYLIYEQPLRQEGTCPPELENPTLDKPTLDKPTLENPTQLNKDISSKEKQITDISNPIPSVPSRKSRRKGLDEDAIEKRAQYRALVLSSIDFDVLLSDESLDQERLSEFVELIIDTVCSNRKTIRIAGDDFPADVVRSRFLKLDSECIRYVLHCMEENTSSIRNIKQYMLAALYNAPATVNSYWAVRANHDMKEGLI